MSRSDDNPPRSSLEVVNQVGRLISGDPVPDQPGAGGKSELARVLSNYKTDLKAFQVAVARHKAGRVARLTEYVEEIEDRLMTSVNLDLLTPGQLIRMLAIIDKQNRDDLSYINEVAKEDQVNVNYQDNRSVAVIGAAGRRDGVVAELGKENRERVRKALESLIKRAKQLAESGKLYE